MLGTRLNRFAVGRRAGVLRLRSCCFNFAVIISLTLCLGAVIASVNQISLKEAIMGVLRDRMIEEMKLRNFSTATQESYVYAVSRLARYHDKSPDQLSKEDIRAFLVHLTMERKLSPNSLTGYCSGLRFFYNETLGWDETKLFIPPRKKSSLLPEVFSPDEVVRLIGAARGLKQRVLLMTAYSAGLRVSELVNLKITDIDAAAHDASCEAR